IGGGWLAVAIVFIAGFSIMGFTGKIIYDNAPPIPTFRLEKDGPVLWTSEDILEGQQIWQSIGGQQVGSVWGHGALQAPDWSADWLHREAVMTLELLGSNSSTYIQHVRKNTYNSETNEVTIGHARAKVLRRLTKFYVALFTGAPSSPEVENLPKMRKLFQVKDVALYSKEKAEKMAGFVFWSSWACVTERPGKTHTYTNNWPQERLVGNRVSPEVIVWSLASVALLVFGIGALAWVRSVHHSEQGQLPAPTEDPLKDFVVTPSMASMIKWVYVVFFLSGFQICLGVYTIHLTIEGNMGFPNWLTQHITYTVARTWHTQSAVFAIATSFLSAGLFLAPAIGGRKEDPPLQKPLCDFLFVCLLVIVGGSMAGQVAAITQSFQSLLMSQYFGHQGYEYVELGRFYQYFLLVGLLLWLLLMVNAVHPALRTPSFITKDARGKWHLVVIITCAAVLISFFWASGLMYNARSNLAVMDYWRFWIVHMWVEGMFEVFITVVVAQVFVMLGVLDPSAAAGVTLFTSGVFLFGGIPGMYHHNYFAGTPSMIMAIGACFSCLEVCPLALMGMEASEYIALEKVARKTESSWLMKYKPIIDCFIYVAFWNLVGAGFLGFIINPPVSQYYMIGGYLTLSHSHGALWGVYGVLAMALGLLVLRLSDIKADWDTRWLDLGLKLMNLGMVLQIFLSIFPIGIYQFWLSVVNDYWYARSEHFHGDPTVQWMKLARGLGDSIFAFAMLMVLWFVFKDFLRRAFGIQSAAAREPLLKQ
ncbi:norB, partial [Symbiodinium pilosum]